MARPSKDLDLAKLKALMRLKPSLDDTAAFFECSARTVERVINKHFKVSFVEFREQNMVHTRLNIVRKAISKAESGDNTMLIFCLKNLCGWRDKQPGEEDKTIKHEGELTSKVVKVDLDERAKQLKGSK